MSADAESARGSVAVPMREALCKDCRRRDEDGDFAYSESWAKRKLDVGESRSDRCPACRRRHRGSIAGLMVPYVDLETIAEVADRDNPRGPLGGLGPLPAMHRAVAGEPVDLQRFEIGLTDDDMLETLASLEEKRALVLEAGTGTGKSTFAPMRLLYPPERATWRPTDVGPIIVTEPRRQAATGVAKFVANELCGTGCGPGFPVGYQVHGEKAWDDACGLVYVTDGTLINWLGEGKLGMFSVVIVDEAHERSSNIDYILGFLRREMFKHPHLRVIIASATLNAEKFVAYFGGPKEVEHQYVPAVKSFGYGQPLFPGHGPGDVEAWLREHWPKQWGPVDDRGPDHPAEDLWATTRLLNSLRFPHELAPDDWQRTMAKAMADQVVRLVKRAPPGDILGFLPSQRITEKALALIEAAIDPGDADLFDLFAATPDDRKEEALAARPRGARRKVVISSNLAETSLTVPGVRYVVDSGLIAQSKWDPELGRKSVPTKPHSQAGLKQRWGRVGRDAPGWVFPLYSAEAFASLDAETPPGVCRASAEQFALKAMAGGIENVAEYEWLALFEPGNEAEEESAGVLRREIPEALRRMKLNGALDGDGQPTDLGRDLEASTIDPAKATALHYADALCCAPEVLVAMEALLGTHLVGRDCPLRYQHDWPAPWRVAAATAHRALATGCVDDLQLALRIFALWERAEDSEALARSWWLNHERLLAIEQFRREQMETLSPAMKEEALRPLDPRLALRARAAISRAVKSAAYRETDGVFLPVDEQGLPLERGKNNLIRAPEAGIVLSPQPARDGGYVENVVALQEWAIAGDVTPLELMARVAKYRDRATAEGEAEERVLDLLRAFPVGARIEARFARAADGWCAEPRAVEAALAPDFVAMKRRRYREDLGHVDWDPNASPDAEVPEEELENRVLDPRDSETPDQEADRADNHEVAVASTRSEAEEPPLVQAPVYGLVPSTELAWVRVEGYSASEDGLAVEVAPGEAAAVRERQAGDQVEVLVGGWAEDHRQWMRILMHGQERFYLDPPSGRDDERRGLPVVLNLRDRDGAERLNEGQPCRVTLVGGEYGTLEPTLLPWLLEDLGAASRRAKVISEANESGYVDVVLAGEVEHRFGLRVVERTVAPGDAVPVGVKPAPPPHLTLVVDAGTARELAQRHPQSVAVRGSGDEVELRPRLKPLPPSVAGELAALRPQDPEWARHVWGWWSGSHCRRVELSSEPATLVVPRYLRPYIRGIAKAFRDSHDLRVSFAPDGAELRVPELKPGRPHPGMAALAELLAAPALTIDVPSEKRGRVIGTAGANIAAVRILPDVMFCDFADDSLLIVAREPVALRPAAETILGYLSEPPTGRVYVAPGENGKLIGGGGATINDLKARSGVTSAQSIGGGSEWSVRGPSAESITAFVRLAGEHVSEIKLVALTAGPPVIRVAQTGKAVAVEGIGPQLWPTPVSNSTI